MQMTMRLAGVAILAALSTSPSIAADMRPCPPRWGKPGTPLVPDAETANRIFQAVEEKFFPTANKARFAAVEAMDDGDYWSVFRGQSEAQRAREPNLFGGGQLEMRIAKCDGAISDVYFSK